MFVVIYKWALKQERAMDFADAWSQLTAIIKTRHGSLGSRLHVARDGTWVAYAQWPDRHDWARWDNSATAADEADLIRAMLSCSVSLPEKLEMEVWDDQLASPERFEKNF